MAQPNSKYLVVAVSLLAATACGLLSVLSLSASLIALPAAGVIDRLRRGEVVSTVDISETAMASIRAGQLFEPARYFSDAALAVSRLPSDERRRATQGTSELAIVEAALIAGPASPHNWARRAALQYAAGDIAAARASLDTSLMLGRFVPGLTIPRLRIILLLAQRTPDPALEGHFAEQVRLAARSEPVALATFADGGAAEGRTQRILAPDFVLYDAYLKALRGVREARAASTPKARR